MPSQGSHRTGVLRRLLRPLLSPLDGRVADINRRVEGSGDRLQSSLDAVHAQVAEQRGELNTYILSSSETASFVGQDLRRLSDQMASLEDAVRHLGVGSFERYYEARLARVADAPLAELDEPLARAINYATGHQGFLEQAGLWFNTGLTLVLGAGAVALALVNERIVELPFALAALRRLNPGARILDIGSAESTFPLSAASLGYQVTAIDPRPIGYRHPNLEIHAGRLEDWSTPEAPFDAAFLISTIEHVGLGAYGEQAYGDPDHGQGADRELLERVRQLLVADGLLVLTTPYGARSVDELERVYDEQSLTELLRGWEVIERQLVRRRDALVWEPCARLEPGERGVVMLVASATRG